MRDAWLTCVAAAVVCELAWFGVSTGYDGWRFVALNVAGFVQAFAMAVVVPLCMISWGALLGV